MVQQIEEANVGIVWGPKPFPHAESVRRYLAQRRQSLSESPSPEPAAPELPAEVLTALEQDVGERIRDKLSRVSLWWLLECLPLTKHYLSETGEQWKRLSYVIFLYQYALY